jgi:hypothetical protein
MSEPMALMGSMEKTISKVRVGKYWVFGEVLVQFFIILGYSQ